MVVEGALEAGLCKGEMVDEEEDDVYGRCRPWPLKLRWRWDGCPVKGRRNGVYG
jgi:hypothetical protein